MAKKKDQITFSISFPASGYFIEVVQNYVGKIIKNYTPFKEDRWVKRFQSVVDELCNNAVEHGSSKNDEVKIIFNINNETVEIIVEDSGTGKKKIKAKELKKMVDQRHKEDLRTNTTIRGRGLPWIVSAWMDKLHFGDRAKGGIRVRVIKYAKNKN